MNKLIVLLSAGFVLFSFFPSLYEISQAKYIPPERVFVLEHNYMFDYNFYLSRIRGGIEGRWTVVEKYYNQPHKGSQFQIIYLYLGKICGLFGLTPEVIYHGSRIIFGLIFLLIIGKYISSIFAGIWQIVAFLFVVTLGSWPIPVAAGIPVFLHDPTQTSSVLRFATYMGWWSVIDSLQRITFIPHILFGQIFLLLFIWWFSSKSLKVLKSLILGVMGFAIGIVFPPTLIVIYMVFIIQTLIEFAGIFISTNFAGKIRPLLKERVMPRTIFFLISLPSILYLQVMFKKLPWSALALFDVLHRIPLPYKEYALALGPLLPLGLAGMVLIFIKKDKKLYPLGFWIIAIFILFAMFENVPQQSPLRFTEAAIHIPLGILATFLFQTLWTSFHGYKRSLVFVERGGLILVVTVIILTGISVMFSMAGWLTDQVYARRLGTWSVPIGAQLAYPLKDFMDAINYLRDNTDKNSVVLSYITAGNFIPAYAGNFVYIGHANTPDEDSKEAIAKNFFLGKMKEAEAREFLKKERIDYIFFGPQERELGNIRDLKAIFPFIITVYTNPQVTIYKFSDV